MEITSHIAIGNFKVVRNMFLNQALHAITIEIITTFEINIVMLSYEIDKLSMNAYVFGSVWFKQMLLF